MLKAIPLFLFCLCSATLHAQVLEGGVQRPGGQTGAPGRVMNRGGIVRDTANAGFQQRDDLKDSITISFRYLDSTRRNPIDSSIHDFDTYFSIPAHHQHLGNNGSATQSLIFNPYKKEGFDAGFHAYDVYAFKPEETRIYRTTRPFSMLGYQLASGKEQMLQAMHTQNPRPNINFGFDYRLISAPGFFVAQNTNHNNYRLFGNYQGKRKRYQGTFVLTGNTLRASQNGGITADSVLKDPNRTDRFSVPVNFGNSSGFRTNPFVTTVNTGITYRQLNALLRQSWDIGQKDSIAINDSTTEYLFYPRLRIQHTLQYNTQSYRYRDVYADSTVYSNWYDITLDRNQDTFQLSEQWKILSNDLSFITFPDARNAAQFLQLGATYESIRGELPGGEEKLYNLIAHGEYRNRTRNKLWDILLKGRVYVAGFNNGDYLVQGSLNRYLNKRWGNIRLHFLNVNRSPSYIFNAVSAFNLTGTSGFSKENHTVLGATAMNPRFTLGVQSHLIANYIYFSGYKQAVQSSDLIQVLQVSASRKTRLTKKWFLYTDVTLQQAGEESPVNVPLLYTRNRLAFEGRFFKNLQLSTGLEVRYYTPYTADNFSPVISQFTVQDTLKINNRPDVAAFLHFRIKSFTGYIRAENLNTMSFENGFGFTHNNFSSPHYPTQGLIIRFGIRWWFVN